MRIAVIPNRTKDTGLLQTKILCDALNKANIEIVMADEYKDFGIACKFTDAELYSGVDVVIVLGGDGTILQASDECAKRNIPIMGINLGRVGFMTETEQDDIPNAVLRLVAGDYKIEERMMMDVCFTDGEKTVTSLALNDCVVSKPDAQMIKAGVFADGEEITEYTSDGVIIATPTGSTGYSLSAGGPVADPKTDVFLATPICAHSLKARPALLASNKTIAVKLFDGANKHADITVDGVVVGKLTTGGEITIKKSKYFLKLIKFNNQSFYDILTAKLL